MAAGVELGTSLGQAREEEQGSDQADPALRAVEEGSPRFAGAPERAVIPGTMGDRLLGSEDSEMVERRKGFPGDMSGKEPRLPMQETWV